MTYATINTKFVEQGEGSRNQPDPFLRKSTKKIADMQIFLYICSQIERLLKFGMKLAIIGSRDCPQIDIMAHLKHLPTEVISGGARGADTYAREFAHKYNLPPNRILTRL